MSNHYKGRLSKAAYARFLVYSRAYQKVMRERRRAAGFCLTCGVVEVQKFVRCLACRRYNVAHRHRKVA